MAAGDPSGVLLVDKPGGMTSHDVVSRARRALNTRRIGHAGTLDPMATGLLVLGVGPATRLLTYLVGLDKTYAATIRLGVSTDSDDADGDITATAAPSVVAALSPSSVDDAVARLRGPIAQVPSRVSAIKVAGRRAYDLARAGEEVTLAARDVVISRFDVLARRPGDGWLDLDVVVDCSSGTYIRALARDLGADLGVGGHLTVLRRTRTGPFEIASAVAIDDLAAAPLLSPAAVAASVMPAAPVSDDQARDLRHGKRVAGVGDRFAGERAAAIAHDGVLVGIVERRGADVKSVMNMPEEQTP